MTYPQATSTSQRMCNKTKNKATTLIGINRKLRGNCVALKNRRKPQSGGRCSNLPVAILDDAEVTARRVQEGTKQTGEAESGAEVQGGSALRAILKLIEPATEASKTKGKSGRNHRRSFTGQYSSAPNLAYL